eukprot:18775-Heterococcus_DN1.PRE.2
MPCMFLTVSAGGDIDQWIDNCAKMEEDDITVQELQKRLLAETMQNLRALTATIEDDAWMFAPVSSITPGYKKTDPHAQ